MKTKLFLAAAMAFGINAFAQIPTSGLVAYYPFSGNANDGSGNGNNGTDYGATLVADRFGNPNSAYSFNGSDSIVVPNSSSLQFSGNTFSISFWVKYTSFASSSYDNILISKQSGSGATQQGFDVYQSNANGNTGFLVSNGGGNFGGEATGTLSLSTVYHVVTVYNSGTATTYLNGVPVNTGTSTATVGANIMPLIIGAANWYNINAQPFSGVLDDIGIWNRALTPTEVTQLYNITSCSADVTTGLVARYDFTGNANDLSGNSNNGTVTGATLTTDRFGNANSAYSFNGTTDYIQVANSSSLQFASNIMSISFWINYSGFAASGNANIIMSKQSGSGATEQGFNIYQGSNANGNTGLLVSNGGGNFGGEATGPFALNQVDHVVVVYNNGAGTSYLNGVAINTGTSTATIGSNTMPMLFGKANWINVNAVNFNGVLDDIRIYNRVLNACDVDSLYHMANPNTMDIKQLSSNSKQLTVYPNPTSSILNLELGIQNETTKVQVLNTLGETVIQNSEIVNQKCALDVSSLPAGVYFVQVGTATQKFVKQ